MDAATMGRVAGCAGDNSMKHKSLMGDVGDVAQIVHVSRKHVRRMADAGRMPRPVRLGRRLLWSLAEIEAWIADGCRPVRKGM